jgi:glycosyltransferase involved in cell wall biosynthesis
MKSNSQLLPVTAIILAKNEEEGLADTLAQLVAFDQVIVVDSHSTDSTVDIATNAGAEVTQFTWDGKYPKKKQWALENAGARHRWILLLDADEKPSASLIAEIRGVVSTNASDVGAYDISLSYRFAGRVLKYGHKVTKRSLLDASRVRFPEVDDLSAPGIREVEGHYQPEVVGRIGQLNGKILHDDQDPVTTWFDRHNRYSDWESHLRLRPTTRANVASKRTKKGQLFDRVPFKPVAFFAYSYIARAGFLDGRAGLDYALALSMYYWQIDMKVRELKTKRSSGNSSDLGS